MGRFGDHKIGYVVTVVLTTAIMVFITIVLTFMAHFGGVSMFKNTTDTISETNSLEITPSRAGTLSLWVVLYLWQLAWLAYSLSLLGRKGIDGFLYRSPTILPIGCFIVFAAANGLLIGWLLLWDSEVFIASFVFTFLLTFALALALVLSLMTFNKTLGVLAKHGKVLDVWLVRALHQNGLAFFVTWSNVLMLLNLATVMSYTGDVSPRASSTAALCVLLIETVAWFAVDIFVLDRFVRYTVTPYVVLVWVLSSILDRNYISGARNSVLTAVILALTLALTVAKVVLLSWRHVRLPLHEAPVAEVSAQNGYDVKIEPHRRVVTISDLAKTAKI